MSPQPSPRADSSMKAYVYAHARGGLERNLRLSEVPVPRLPARVVAQKPSILVSVSSVSLNPADYSVPEDAIVGRLLIRRRATTPCFDFAGRVAAIPAQGLADLPHLKHLNEGDWVLGRLDWIFQHGALAEYTLAQPTGLVPLPNGLSVEQAAALGTAGLTAYQSLASYVRPGDRVFINGGSGGVGTFTIQIAKLLGAGHVTATCSAANVALCRELGADEVVDYRSVDVIQELEAIVARDGSSYDHMVDNVGSNSSRLFERSPSILKCDGVYVQVAVKADSLAGIWSIATRALRPAWLGGVPRRWSWLLAKNNVEQLQKLADWLHAGQLKAVVDSEYEFGDACQAFVRLKTGRARGKVIVNVQSSGD